MIQCTSGSDYVDKSDDRLYHKNPIGLENLERSQTATFLMMMMMMIVLFYILPA